MPHIQESTISMSEKVISPLTKDVIHRICTGQVILSLSAAVKELVENSLDARATTVEIKIRDFGLGDVEISDNGIGIDEKNFHALAKAHSTSKIGDFSHLYDVRTFGFRGEALSALAALSDLSIVTRNVGSEVAFKLQFDHQGNIVDQSTCARTVGTTVVMRNFFDTLIVRRREFEKHCKREFAKVTSLINAYCLINYDVRFELIHISNSNRRQIVCKTFGSKISTLKTSICALFGDKQFDCLVEIKNIERPDDQDLAIYNIDLQKLGAFPRPIFQGYVSGPRKEQGRSISDRQYIFINGRPCDYSKICKLANEIYREFNRSYQYPVLVLNIVIDQCNVDINITPDKRTVFVAEEKILLAYLRTALRKSLNFDAAQFALTNSSNFTNSSEDKSSNSRVLKSPNQCDDEQTSSERSPVSVIYESDHSKETSLMKRREDYVGNGRQQNGTLDNFVLTFHEPDVPVNSASDSFKLDRLDGVALNLHRKFSNDSGNLSSNIFDFSTSKSEGQPSAEVVLADSDSSFCDGSELSKKLETAEILAGVKRKVLVDELIDSISMSKDNGEAAENLLSKRVDKTSFKSMQVVGQFNAGFILAIQPATEDLFIIDQHASDEKFNFELQQMSETVIGQKLVIPQTLADVSPCELNIIADNLHVFRRNGFEFLFNYSNDSSEVKLSAIPSSGKDNANWKNDLNYLIKMQNDFPGTFCRPPSVRALFASKACRKSVMIGHILNRDQMKRIVSNMAEIDQPWNCPHGRPTMRHLLCLKGLLLRNGNEKMLN
uniref:Mismatch repair endonuclease PMS2 n=1 Tax=Romanomermis culicivorax TaxID=13658 RepID=A0A915JX10_ROMCU